MPYSPVIPLARAIESFRDWGRDCYCAPGKDNTCGKRFDWQLGKLPCGYDHKYTYSHAGTTSRSPTCRRHLVSPRWPALTNSLPRASAILRWARLAACEEFLILPEATPDSDPSWFAFC